MRKLTLLIISLLCYVGVLHAQALVADGVYTLSADVNKQRGELVAAADYNYPVLEGIDLAGYTGNSTAAQTNGQYWYVQSVDASSNTYYIYNIAKGKYLVNENGNVNFGDNPYVWTFVTNANNPAYLNIKDANKTGDKVWLSSGCGRTASQRPVQWDKNNNDGGALYTFTRISDYFATPETGKFYKIKGDGELPWLTANATSGGNVVVSNDEASAGVFLKTQNGIQAVATGKYLGYSGGKYTYSETPLTIELRNTGTYLANYNNRYAVVSGGNFMFNNNNDGIVHESNGELDLPRLWAFIEVEAPAATVNGVLYETLQDAVEAAQAAAEAAQASQTLTLWKNSDETIELPIGVILEKNGFTADHVTDKELTYVYNFVYGGTVEATQEGPVTLGAAFPAINAEYKPFGVELTNVPEGNVALSDFNDEGKVIKDITVTISDLPFVAAADNASIENWYYIQMHSYDASETYNKHIQSVSATEVKWADNSVAAVKQDACTWGFVGNPYDGFKVVNYATGTAIAADGDAPVLNEAGVLWIVTASSYNEDAQHFCLKYPDEIKYLNANAETHALGFWQNPDAGSTMWVTSRDIDSEVTELETLVNQANDLVEDWSGKVGDLTEDSKDAVAAAITTAQAAISSKKNLAVAKQGLEAAMENVQRIEAAAKIGDVLYATLAEAANVATKGQTVTILRSTDETAVFAYGVVIEKAEGVVAPNATNEVAVDVPANVVGEIVNNSGVETETVNGVVGALQNNEAVISNTPTNLPVGAKLVVTLVNIIFESEAPAKVVYDVTPKNGDAEVEPTEEITFRLPVPANWKYAKVYHETALEGIYPVQEGNYVEVASQDFSEFAVEIAEPVAKIDDVDYYTFEAALDAATEGQTITLVADVTCAENPVFDKGGVVNVDINGHVLVSNEQGRIRNVASADGTVASNNIKFVSGFGWEVYSGNGVEGANFRVFPTLNEAVAYIPAKDRVARIYLYENIKLENDVTLRKYSGGTSSTICVEPGYEITLDLNGYTVLQESPTGNPLEACIRGKFILDDTSDAKTGKWIAGACGVTDTSNGTWYGNGGPAFYVLGDGELILKGGTVSIARNTSMNSNGEPVVNKGGLIRLDSGSLTIDGATLQCDDTYGVMAWGGDVVVNSGEFVMGEKGVYSVFASSYYADASVEVNTAIDGYLLISSPATATVNAAGVKYVANGTDYVAPEVAEGLVAQGGVVGYPVAKIGEAGYLTLEAAVAAAAQTDETVTLVNNVALETPVVISGKALTLDLGAYTIEDKSTAVLTKEDDVWALIDLENGANLTVRGTGTIKANYANVQGGWTGMAYCINVDNTSKLTVDGGNFINGNGGVQTLGEVVVNGGTFVSHNGGTCIMATYTDAKVTVNGGTFKDSVEESDVYTGSGAVWAGFGAKIEIKGGTFDFAADPEHENVVWTLFPAQNAIAGYGVNAEMAVSGGTFVNFNPAEDVIVDYSPSTGFTFGSVVAEGYTVVANGDGTYSVEVELPEVVITDIKGSLTDSDPDLTFALNFAIKDVANLDPEYLEKLFAQYGDWYTDYVLTISGLTDEDVTFNANGDADGYLSGQYDAWSENWVSVPFEDVTLENGASIYIMEYAAKLMNKQGLRFTLAEVAEIVQNFDCGVYFTPEFLAANPGLKVDLHLKVFTEDAEGNKVNDINVATNNFDIEDYVAIVHADDKQTQYCTTLADAVAAAADGATITMLRDVVLTEAVKVVGKAITLDLNGKTVSGTCNSNQGYLVYIENGAGLTVKDGAVDGGGKLTYAQGTSNVGWTVDVEGNLTLESGTIELTGEWSIGYAVDVRPNAWGVAYTNPSVFTMNGGKLVSSDGAVRVASSSADQYANVSASFEMNGGEIDAAWDGVFIQQSNTAYDVLNFTINNGTIKGGLNPVRVYGPAPTSYVNGQECMSINFNGGTMTYTGTETREWVIDGVLRVGGGSSIETIVENGNITASEAFAQAQALPEGYIWEQDGETYKVVEAPKVPEVVDGKIEFVDGEFDMYTNDTDIENVEITYKRTIDSDWNALYVPFAIPASELLADFDIAYINDVRETDEDDDGELDGWQMELIKIKNETAVLRANHPYFVRSKSADYTENNLSLTLTTTLYKATVAEFECSSVYSTYTVKGLNELRASTEFGDADRVLGYDNGETTWGKMADGYSLKPFRFYLTITNHDGSPVLSSSAQMSIVVRDEDGTTGIDGIYGDENGETVIFDLYGRRVLEPEKGNIYIINGKKVLVK